MQEQIMHREVVAALASYKAALRSAASALTQQQEPARVKAALERATTACAAAQKCLQTVSDQRLPLDTSKRLADIDLPSLVQQLLQAAVDSHLVEGSNAAAADSVEAAAPGTTPAPAAADWTDVQGCITECFECLALLAAVACRACTRSNDPLLVLEQLAAPGLANSSVAFMQHINGATTAADSVVRAAAVAAPCAYYGPFAAAVDAQGVLQPVRTQLSATLSSSMYLPAAAALLLAARGPDAPAKVAQQGAHHLLTIALLLSGDSLLTAWHLDSPTTAAANTAAAAEAAAAAASGSQPLCEQLVAAPVLEFLEERLYHAALELHCSSATPDLDASIRLLPGRAVLDGGMELQAAALRALRCWRAILRSGAAARARFAATPRTSQLLLAALSAVLADPVRAGSTDRQSLRSRVCKVCIDCLQMLTARLAPDALLAVLRPLLVDCTDMLVSVAQFVDVHKHAAKSSELPLSARLKTMDRGTADVVQRYCATAEQAVDIVQAVLRATASSEEPSPLTSACVGVLMASGMLPALEGVFRTIPPACQAQVAAAELLVHLLPHYPFGAGADTAGDQALLSLLITLRKFIINCANLPEPDRELGVHVALAAEALLTRLVSSAAAAANQVPPSSGLADSLVCTGNQALLLRHAMQQLLPAIQAMCTVLLKVPAAGTVMCGQSGSAQHLFLYLFKLLRSVAQLHDQRPDLQLLPLLAAHGSLPLAAAMLGTGFYATPQGFSLLGELPSACSLGTREYLAKQVLQLLEVCIAHTSAPTTSAPAPASTLPDPVKPSAEGVLVVDVVVEAGPEARSPSPPTPPAAPTADAGGEVWRAALLRGLLHSRLLPEVQRLLLQLGAGTHTSDECVGAAVMGALSETGAMRRLDSSSLLSPATSGGLLERGGSGRLVGRPVQKSDSWGGLQSAISSSLNSARSDGLPGAYSQPSTPAASNGLRDSLPIPGVSVPPINTRPLQREGSGSIGAGLLRGTSPTAFSAGLATRSGAPRSRGATPVAGSSAMGGSFGSLSSMGSGFWGGALSSPVGTASNTYFDSLLKTSAVAVSSARGEGGAPDAMLAASNTVLAALQHRLDRLLVATGRQVLDAAQKAGDMPAAVGGGISRQGSGAVAAGGVFAATAAAAAAAPAAAAAAAPAPVPPAGPQQEADKLHKAMAAMVLPTPALSKLSDALRASPAATPGSSPRAGAGDTSPAAAGPRAADRFNMLRTAIASAGDALAAQDAAAAAAGQQAGAGQLLSAQGSVNSVVAGMSGGGASDAAGDAGLVFPLEVAASELRSNGSSMGASPPEGGLLAGTTSSPVPAAQAAGDAAAGEVAAVLPPALLRRLLAALAAATPPAVQLLDKTAGTLCVDALCSQVRPLPLGCWNPACTLLVGLSESKGMLRPCTSCGVAVYCSKACEKAAWPTSHKGACASLKAQAEAGLLQAPVLPEPVARRSTAGLVEGRAPLLGPRMARMSSGM